MANQALKYWRRLLVGIGFATCLLVHTAASPAWAATEQQLGIFLADPGAILRANPNGGGKLVSTVRDLLMSDQGAMGRACKAANKPTEPNCILSALIALLSGASAEQQSAIGSGMGQAAQTLTSTNPIFANQIQTALAASGSDVAIASFATTTGNVAIGANGGGGGGGGGPVSGGAPIGGGGGGGGNGGQGSNSGGSGGSGLTGGGNVNGGGNSQGQNSNSQGQNSNSQGNSVSQR
jgi:hypothetical protein